MAVCAPSSGVEVEFFPRLDLAIAHLKRRGLRVIEGATLRRELKQCSAPAAERAAELQQFLLDPNIAAVMPPWGGERAIELLPLLDFERIAAVTPKWFCGFSDLSTLQLPLCLRAGWMSLHGPNLMELGADELDSNTAAIWSALCDAPEQPLRQQASERWQSKGIDWRVQPGAGSSLTEVTRWQRLDGQDDALHLSGRLIGGCLDSLSRIAGTPFGDLRAWRQQAGIGPHLLFLENAEMVPCELLRALYSLRLHGWFDQTAGVLIGRHAVADTSSTAHLSLKEAVQAALGDLGLPVLIDADIGHMPPQLSLIQGEWAELHWSPQLLELRQMPAICADLTLPLLMPEIMTTTNPLLSTAALPAFASIKPEHIAPAITALLSESRAALSLATSDATPADYDALSATLGVATEQLGHAWGAIGHLNAVANTPELREAYNGMLPAVTEFFTELGADEALYAKYKAIAAAPGAASLSAARQQALKLWLRDFVLSGAELQGVAKERFAAIQERSAELGQQFSEHVLDATDGYAYYATAEELDGVPADAVSAALEAAKAEDKEGHKLTLHLPVYLPVMQYASNRDLRARLYRAYVTRASELGDKPDLDNSAIIEELLRLRQEEAALLGFANFAEAAMVAKMADSPTQVLDFLRDLGRRARPFADKDLAELREFSAKELGLSDLQPWDSAYASENLKEARYAFSDQEVRQYFTVPRVLAGLFDIIERLFNVKISEQPAEVWHESVKFYQLVRDGSLVGQFYLDLYARPGKRPGAWMDEVRSRWARPDGAQQTPVAQLVCNFSSPVGDKPALLSHDDVTTLFHEFGHGLHHLLTQVDELGVSGISGVEWDAVELPSQFMENFCWEWEVVQQLTSHVDSGDALPRELFDKMTAAKNFQSGLQTLRQIEFSVFDMRLHAEKGSETAVQALLDEVRAEIAVMAAPAFNRSQHSFSHIFAGGYSAGYYSYKWAELLSADAWSAFEVEGVFNAACGQRYLQNVLEVGGSRPAMESFKAFRGREPQIDALLRHQGMA